MLVALSLEGWLFHLWFLVLQQTLGNHPLQRRQRAVETLPEFGQDVRRLANLAYPTTPNDVRETLAKEQFIDSLIDGDMRLRIKQARPINLNDAIRHAVDACCIVFRRVAVSSLVSCSAADLR
jgi:hypothetical protein